MEGDTGSKISLVVFRPNSSTTCRFITLFSLCVRLKRLVFVEKSSAETCSGILNVNGRCLLSGEDTSGLLLDGTGLSPMRPGNLRLGLGLCPSGVLAVFLFSAERDLRYATAPLRRTDGDLGIEAECERVIVNRLCCGSSVNEGLPKRPSVDSTLIATSGGERGSPGLEIICLTSRLCEIRKFPVKNL